MDRQAPPIEELSHLPTEITSRNLFLAATAVKTMASFIAEAVDASEPKQKSSFDPKIRINTVHHVASLAAMHKAFVAG